MLVQQRRGSKRPKRTDFFTGGKELTQIYANKRRNLRNFRKRTTNGEERKLLLRAERERRRIRAVCPPAAYNRGLCALPDPKAYRKRRYNGPTRSDPASSLLRTRAGRRRLTGHCAGSGSCAHFCGPPGTEAGVCAKRRRAPPKDWPRRRDGARFFRCGFVLRCGDGSELHCLGRKVKNGRPP